MDALVMCGGRGTRLGGETEKPLVRVGGRPMVDRVLDALAESRVETVHAVVSPHATATRERLVDRAAERADLAIVDAPGEGYVADLQYAVDAIGTGETTDSPVVTVAADLPLLDGEAVDAVLDAARQARADTGDGRGGPASLTVCVPTERKRELGVSADAAAEIEGRDLAPAGINVVGAPAEGDGESDGDGSDGDSDDDGSDGDSDDDGSDGDSDDDSGALHVTDDARFAVNVNYPSDVRIAERLLAGDDAPD